MVAGRKEHLNKCGSCSLKSVVVTGRTRAATGEPPTQLPPYIRPRTSSPNKLQVCKGGAQPQEKRINQISTTGGTKNKYQYPQNRDNKALTVTVHTAASRSLRLRFIKFLICMFSLQIRIKSLQKAFIKPLEHCGTLFIMDGYTFIGLLLQS